MTNIRMAMYIFIKAFHPYEWLYIASNFSLTTSSLDQILWWEE